MKTLNECKAYYQDMYLNWLDEHHRKKSFGEPWLDRVTTLQEALTWIYGSEFKTIELQWIDEAIDKYYERIATEK